MNPGLARNRFSDKETDYDPVFLKAMQDYFAGRRHGEIGLWRYSGPLFAGDPVRGLEKWNEISLRAKAGDGKYYVFTDEVALIDECAEDIAALVDDDVILIDLGIGGNEALEDKIKRLIQALGPKLKSVYGVDKVISVLANAAAYYKKHYPDLDFTPLDQNFFREKLRLPHKGQRLSVIFGQTMFNIPGDPRNPDLPKQMILQMLKQLRSNLRPGDRLVITQDCNEDWDETCEAYAEFRDWWENLMDRVQRDLPVCDRFNPRAMVYDPYPIRATHALAQTQVAWEPMYFGLGDENFSLCAGTRRFAHNTFKYPQGLFLELADQAGLKAVYTRQNLKQRSALHVFEPK